ncbi:DNA polymerase III subunit delta [Corynebacterium suranareeae]|uniref:DNA polymerase III subunit delta n=1 Tax=Corynebacterium suranareeae TaxID=2506452 RepID=A0A160PTR4_9CORY|nr:DNA polymerase III subunit delta [Corynebacterium suranareeae]BAU96683.1 DNA polymerase III subunit delta [Corynebacterium suranareeae]
MWHDGLVASAPISVQPSVHLILGDDEFLAERARLKIVQDIRESMANPDSLQVSTLKASEITQGELLDALSPSLFAEDRVVVLTNMDQAGQDAVDLTLSAAVNPGPGTYLIVMHSGGGRSKSMVKKLEKIAVVHGAEKLKDRDRPAWVKQEFKNHKVAVTPDVVHALLEGVGSDLRELASAVSQLVDDTQGNVTVEKVRDYYVGVAEVSGFDIADSACAGQVSKAVASTRRALQLGTSPVALAAALSMKVGQIARLYSTRGRINGFELAKELGMPPFVVEKTAKVARNWSGDSVSEAVILMADLDAAVKGQSGDPEFAIEAAVRKVAELARR